MAEFWKVEKIGTAGGEILYKSYEKYPVIDITGTEVFLQTNVKEFTIRQLNLLITESQVRVNGEIAYRQLLEQIKAAALLIV